MGHKQPPAGYITAPAAARIIGISNQTMYDWIKKRRVFPYIKQEAGARAWYYVKESDVADYVKAQEPVARRKAKVYEIVTISLGQLSVLFTTSSLLELSHMYIRMLERENKLIRIRADGELLTIHESDKLGNTFHPRTKRRAI